MALGIAAAGCAMKAKPSTGAGFVAMDSMAKIESLPFHKAWYQNEDSLEGYAEIVVAAVNTQHIRELDWWKALGRGRKMEQDLPQLSAYTEEAFRKAFREDANHRFTVLESTAAAGPKALVLELALTEVVPSQVVLNTIGYAPFVGTAARILRGASARSTVAFEARLKDAANGEIIATFADRESEKFAPVNLKDITWYGHTHAIIDRWASQFVQVLNRKSGDRIKDSKPFTLKPW